MPIKPIVLQRRFAEFGRIRLGYQAPTQNGRTRPAKLAAFRFTSAHERYINDLATLYGGEPKPWDNGGKPEYEVFTDASSIPVIAMKGGLSQWMETWSGGGCIHRCDGETNALTGEACDLNERVTIGRDTVNPHEVARPTTRLSLMLPELDAIGAWRMESHGWNAAAEIPAVAELAQFVGDLVPAHLNMIERRSIRDGKTSRFVVPVLDLQIGAARLREVVAAKSGAPLELAAGGEQPAGEQRAALPASSSHAPVSPFAQAYDAIEQATTLDRMTEIWDVARAEGLVGEKSQPSAERDQWVAAFTARARTLKGEQPSAAPAAPAPAPQPNPDGTYDADVVEEAPPAAASTGSTANIDDVWAELVRVAGQQGMSLPDLQDDFARRMDGLTADAADAEQLQHYMALITQEQAA